MNLDEISEFRTTWNNELFRKNRSTFIAAKRLIRKSIVIGTDRTFFFHVLVFFSLY